MKRQQVHEPGLALHVEDLTVAYEGKPALWDIDVNVPPGVMAAIIGPNGAGKSTLLKTALGLTRPTAGHICVHGRPPRDSLRRIGYVPQRSSVDWDFPTTVLDVVMMGRYGHLGWLRWPGASRYTWRISPSARSASSRAVSNSACFSRAR